MQEDCCVADYLVLQRAAVCVEGEDRRLDVLVKTLVMTLSSLYMLYIIM